MNKGIREKLVKKLVKEQTNWVIGGHENNILDGHTTKMPARELLESEIYQEVMNAKYVESGNYLVPIKKDIRFLGSAVIRGMITERVTKVLKEG